MKKKLCKTRETRRNRHISRNIIPKTEQGGSGLPKQPNPNKETEKIIKIFPCPDYYYT